jgi:ribosomal protein S12 methylthiotransferase accessory factor YcaO
MRSRAKLLAAPVFAEGSGPKLLIEDPDAWAYADRFERAGFRVAVCDGPRPVGAECNRCPLVSTGRCAAVESADVILSALPSDVGMPIVAALGERARKVPTVLHVPGPRAADYEKLLGGATIVPFPASDAQLEAAIRGVLVA